MRTRMRSLRPLATQLLATGLVSATALGLPALVGAPAAEAAPAVQRFQPGMTLSPKPVPWQAPVAGYRLTAQFGASTGPWASGHTGLDFAAPEGTPLSAIAEGVVTQAGYDGSYGNKTVITLADGTELWYCHQSSFAVAVGQQVGPGDLVGYVGSTGNVTGPHLHLEVRPGAGSPVDPAYWLDEHHVAI